MSMRAFLVLLAGGLISLRSVAADKRTDFTQQVRPILSDKCFRCHGPDAAHRQADLRLDDPAVALAPRGDQPPVIVPGRSSASAVVDRIESTDPALRMPPEDSGISLTPQEIRILRQWIDEGAAYSAHWSFVPPQSPPLPEVRGASWPVNPIDYFVLAKLESAGLTPSPEAEKAALLRRVTLDLTGLPPTPAERDDFLADTSPLAFEAVVDRLLASPHYGEAAAVDWLDAARYADTNGYFSDHERQAWRWRDWVVAALNSNLPFDQFTIEQLAGDLLPQPTTDQLVATGFNRNHMVTDEGGVIEEEYRVEYVADRLETTATVWLGLTVGCARCHDHKYDPWSQRDYYRMFAYFNNMDEAGRTPSDSPPPVISVPDADQRQRLEELVRLREESQRVALASADGLSEQAATWERSGAALEEVSTPAPHLERGLTAHYDFDGRLTETAGRGTGRDRQAAPVYGPGVRGQSLVTDSESWRELPAGHEVESDRPWTLSFWFLASSGKLSCLLSKAENEGDRRGLEVLWKKGRLTFKMVHRYGESLIDLATRQPRSADGWRHVVISSDGSGRADGIRIYSDGQPEDLQVFSDTLRGTIRTAEPWSLGRRDAGFTYSGQLDEWRLYERTLTTDEVLELYRRELLSGILQRPAGERSPGQQETVRDEYLRRHGSPELRLAWQTWRAAETEHAALSAAVPVALIMQEREQPRPAFILMRGQYDQPADQVAAGLPDFLPRPSEDVPPNRLGLARWLVQPGHPLTARVTVNRFWQQLFGAGIVRTPGDFGSQGDLPTHPELLDWLAVEFQRSGWDIKAIRRLMVTSATYRQSARVRRELVSVDPQNRLLGRSNRFRLPAETLRDQALAVSGLLVPIIGGSGKKPYQPEGLWEAVSYNAELTYEQDHHDLLYRRGVYTFWKRQAPPPGPLVLDTPTREACVTQRQRTNTPQQALVLLNDPVYAEAARALAERILRAGPREVTDRVRLAFRLVTCREPLPHETACLTELYHQQYASFREDLPAADAVRQIGEWRAAEIFEPAEHAAWSLVAGVLLNLDETLTRP